MSLVPFELWFKAFEALHPFDKETLHAFVRDIQRNAFLTATHQAMDIVKKCEETHAGGLCDEVIAELYTMKMPEH